MKKYLAYAVLPALAISMLGAGVVSANGWFGGNASPEEIAQKHETMFENRAEILGITAEELKQAWADGKKLCEIAEEQGLTQEELQERMREVKIERLQTHIQTLVADGKISQEQANEKMENMQEMFENGNGKIGKGFRNGMKGLRGGFGI